MSMMLSAEAPGTDSNSLGGILLSPTDIGEVHLVSRPTGRLILLVALAEGAHAFEACSDKARLGRRSRCEGGRFVAGWRRRLTSSMAILPTP
jgi:hypothetical protein